MPIKDSLTSCVGEKEEEKKHAVSSWQHGANGRTPRRLAHSPDLVPEAPGIDADHGFHQANLLVQHLVEILAPQNRPAEVEILAGTLKG